MRSSELTCSFLVAEVFLTWEHSVVIKRIMDCYVDAGVLVMSCKHASFTSVSHGMSEWCRGCPLWMSSARVGAGKMRSLWATMTVLARVIPMTMSSYS